MSGISNTGPIFINNSKGTQNTHFQIETTLAGNILTINGSSYSYLECSESPTSRYKH